MGIYVPYLSFPGGLNIYSGIVAVLYTDINHVIGVCGFESHPLYYKETNSRD